MRKVEDQSCVFDDSGFDDDYHTFFKCDHMVWERQRLEMEIGPMTPDNITGSMLMSRKGLDNVGDLCNDGYATEEADIGEIDVGS